jgi:hypothetical protein
MTREEEVRNLLLANDTLRSLMEGGMYTDEEVGVEGVHRGEIDPDDPNYSSTAAAFDADGLLLPMLVVRQGPDTPGSVHNPSQKVVSTLQQVDIVFFQRRHYNIIETARRLSFTILSGVRLTDPPSAPIYWLGDSAYFYDAGPVLNSMSLRQSWMVNTMRKPE